MAQAFRVTEDPAAQRLEERLRVSLREARGNLEIRRQLERLARDPERVAALRRELGPGHALLRDLITLGDVHERRRPEAVPARPAAS